MIPEKYSKMSAERSEQRAIRVALERGDRISEEDINFLLKGKPVPACQKTKLSKKKTS